MQKSKVVSTKMSSKKKNKSSKLSSLPKEASSRLEDNITVEQSKKQSNVGSSLLSEVRCTLSEDKHDKLKKIWSCLTGKDGKRDTIDLWELRLLALSPDGLLHPKIRKLAWPKLIGVVPSNEISKEYARVPRENRNLPPDERRTIQQDVGRTIWRLDEKSKKKIVNGQHDKITSEAILESTIVTALLQCPIQLHYYQGFHDIASLLLLNTLSPSLTSSMLSQISTYHLEDYMQENFKSTMSLLQIGLWVLLGERDEDLLVHLLNSGMQLHGFTLSWVIGWFSHDMKDFEIASRIMDVCLVSHPAMPVYLSATMLLFPRNKEMVMDTECDIASLHCTIKSLPKLMLADEEDVEEWIESALELMALVSPQELISIAHEYEHEGFLDKSLNKAPDINMLNTEFPAQHFSLAKSAPVITEDDFKTPKSYELRNNMYTDLASKKEKMGSFEKVLRDKRFKRVKRHRRAIIAAGRREEYKSIIRKRRRFRKVRRILFGSAVTMLLSKGIWYFYTKKSSGWKSLERTKKAAITSDPSLYVDDLTRSEFSGVKESIIQSVVDDDLIGEIGKEIDIESEELINEQYDEDKNDSSESVEEKLDEFLEEEFSKSIHTPNAEQITDTENFEEINHLAAKDKLWKEDRNTHDQDDYTEHITDTENFEEVNHLVSKDKLWKEDRSTHDQDDSISIEIEEQSHEYEGNIVDFDTFQSNPTSDKPGKEHLEFTDVLSQTAVMEESESLSSKIDVILSQDEVDESLYTDFEFLDKSDFIHSDEISASKSANILEVEKVSSISDIPVIDTIDENHDQSDKESENVDRITDPVQYHLDELDKQLDKVVGTIKAIKQKNESEMMTLINDLHLDNKGNAEILNLEPILSKSEQKKISNALDERIPNETTNNPENEMIVDKNGSDGVEESLIPSDIKATTDINELFINLKESDEIPKAKAVENNNYQGDDEERLQSEYSSRLIRENNKSRAMKKVDMVADANKVQQPEIIFTEEAEEVHNAIKDTHIETEAVVVRIKEIVEMENAIQEYNTNSEAEILTTAAGSSMQNLDESYDAVIETVEPVHVADDEYILVPGSESVLDIQEGTNTFDHDIERDKNKVAQESSKEVEGDDSVNKENNEKDNESTELLRSSRKIDEINEHQGNIGNEIAHVLKQNITNVGNGLRQFARTLKQELATDDAEFLFM